MIVCYVPIYPYAERIDHHRWEDMSAIEQPDPQSVSDDIALTPIWLRVTASWGWRLIVLCGVMVIVWNIGTKLSQLTVPLLIALLIAAGFSPLTDFLGQHRWPRWASSAVSLLLLVFAVLGLLAIVGAQIASQWDELVSTATSGVSSLVNWLFTGPLNISQEQVNGWINQATSLVRQYQSQIAGALTSAGGRIGAFVAGLLTCLTAAFFFLKDGSRMAAAFGKVIPDHVLVKVEPMARGGWTALASYVRAAVTVAAIDGVGAGIGALALGSNLWVAIIAMTFICSFVPIIGAITAATLSAVVVLVTLGPVKAVIMVVVFIAVMNIEANVLQPLLLGRAVEIHPLLILLGITAGTILAGIPGALLAIPAVAFVTGCVRGVEGIFIDDDRGRRKAHLPRVRYGGRRTGKTPTSPSTIPGEGEGQSTIES